MNQLLQINNVSKKYLKNKTFTLNVNQGELILLTGENGSGKSTLLKIILNLIKPDTGFIKFKPNLKMSFLPEKTILPGFIKTEKYLKNYYEIDPFNWDLDFYNKLNIQGKKTIFKLSKGNKQKVAIFKTFLGNNDLLILDEPFSGLDDVVIKAVVKKITSSLKNNLSFIIATHKPSFLNKIATSKIQL